MRFGGLDRHLGVPNHLNRNTKFYHQMAKARAMVNSMKAVVVNGRRVEGKRELRATVTSYFASIFAPNGQGISSSQSTVCPATLPLNGSDSHPHTQFHPSGLDAKISPPVGTPTFFSSLSFLGHSYAPLTPGHLESRYIFPPFSLDILRASATKMYRNY